MQNKKLLTVIIIIFALIILVGLIYFIFLAPVPEEKPAAPAEVKPPAEEAPVVPVAKERRIVREVELKEEDLQRLASSFVERYGSYSNQSGYQNVKDLEVFMSRLMKSWAEGFIAEASRQSAATEIYYGLTTKAVVTETKSFDEFSGLAQFLVKTQRREAIGSAGNVRTFQQEALVEIIKEGGAWKVNRVVWQE